MPDPGFTRLHIFGAGGFGREVAWLAEQSWGERVKLAFVIDDERYLGADTDGVPLSVLRDCGAARGEKYVVAVGDPAIRRRAVAACEAFGLEPARLVHPRAEMSRFVEIEAGAVICAGVIATTGIRIGRHAHVNLDCTIGHDAHIGDFATLSPGVHVSGRVHIGEDVFVGTGAAIINGTAGAPLVIGAGAIVAAGACVTRSVEPGAMVAGVPAVRKR